MFIALFVSHRSQNKNKTFSAKKSEEACFFLTRPDFKARNFAPNIDEFLIRRYRRYRRYRRRRRHRR